LLLMSLVNIEFTNNGLVNNNRFLYDYIGYKTSIPFYIVINLIRTVLDRIRLYKGRHNGIIC
jgi:hypothetical protein